MTNSRLQGIFFTVLIVGVFFLSFLVFKPYLGALCVAVILRIVFDSFHEKVSRFVRGSENLSAVISTLTIVFFIIVPLVVVGVFLFDDIQNLYLKIVSGNIDFSFVERLTSPARDFIKGFIPDFSADLREYAREGLSFLLTHIGSVFSSIMSLIFNFFLMLLALFYLFRDGKRFRKSVIFLSPLSDNYDESILVRLSEGVSSVVNGSLLVAIIQGALAALGFFIFGVPNPMLWGSIAAIAALVPNLGTALVVLPAIVFLFWTGTVGPALGLSVWGVVIIGLIDNILAPYLMERGLKVHPFLVLLGVLGGFAFFGPLGFLVGPVLVALLMALLDMYPSIMGNAPVKK
ncbi:MAG: AI-2E family transporter [bacterium]|nr:AI-2E family transporter [bacterium]